MMDQAVSERIDALYQAKARRIFATLVRLLGDFDLAEDALHGAPVPAGSFHPAANAQTPEQVASAIVDLIDHPRPEIYTNPGQAEIVLRYYSDVAAFEENIGR